ncbi:MAG: molybdenum ABC transporter ATP-binding protein [Deltaproteobacteria bacterium]|nr:molybdenum ABC transporter ATP-binding protein [Deltaproteobacteria bacterium]
MIDVDIVLERKHFDVEIRETFQNGITGIFGQSGSGKTSLLQALAGLVKPKKGRIVAGDRVLLDLEKGVNVPVENRNVGYVFQEGRLFPHMTVEKNLRYGVKKDRAATVFFDDVVDMLDLKHLLKCKPSAISGGERQRTALGRSLLSSPDILFLDEPFSAVDMQLREQILPFILKVQRTFNMPILVVSHDLPDLLKLTNTLCLIKDGKCVGHDEYYQLLKSDKSAEIIGKRSPLNAVEMQVAGTDKATGLTFLCLKNNSRRVCVKCDMGKVNSSPGQSVKLFVGADDISLSFSALDNVTIQNQIEGKIEDIVERNGSTLCAVDVGFRLLVEITGESQRRMCMEPGRNVWCLFKTAAIQAC